MIFVEGACHTWQFSLYFLAKMTILLSTSIRFSKKLAIPQYLTKVGLMLWLLSDFFCSGIQFNLLLSPHPCFISLLYLDLYVLGDDALIS